MQNGVTVANAVIWTAIWFLFMLLYTVMDVLMYRKLSDTYGGKVLYLATIVVCIGVYVWLLQKYTPFDLRCLNVISWKSVFIAAGCAVLFYLLLDKCLDPVFEKAFPESESSYQDTLQRMAGSPVVAVLQTCILAPFIEELLIRGYILGGLRGTYDWTIALAVSSVLFAVLHFNMVQTLSALICGVILGVLFLYTGSVTACIIAHCGYNLISYFTTIVGKAL